MEVAVQAVLVMHHRANELIQKVLLTLLRILRSWFDWALRSILLLLLNILWPFLDWTRLSWLSKLLGLERWRWLLVIEEVK